MAERQIRELRVRSDLSTLEAAVARFREAQGRLPRSLGELVAAGYLRAVPLDPRGQRYDFDPATGAVRSPARRVLGAS